MGYLLSKIWVCDFVLFVQFLSAITLMLHEFLFPHFYWIWFIRLFWKECLCILHCLFKWLQDLFVRVDQHLVIKLKLKFIIRDDFEIKCQISMIAAHSIKYIHHLQSIFPQFYHSQSLLNLNLNWINNQMLLQNDIKEQSCILFKNWFCVGLFLIEFYSEKLTQLL